ncbi:P-loop containing nucleoside triphosphate hydrolase protein [Geopyxis carbonaria]|nr:P-loop containing nucleoside triphosphate hydrolase protein [Geopyxis carbonaria]
MVKPKKKSKRVPVRLRHKIEKRSNEKQRKERKHAKKHPELHPKKKSVQLGIPNSYPFKDQILAEIEEGRRLKLETQAKNREEAKKRRQELKDANDGDEVMDDDDDSEEEDSEEEEDDDDAMSEDEEEGGNSAMAALLASARARAMEYEAKNGDSNGESEDEDMEQKFRGDNSQKSFNKAFKQAVDAADVILYVLDARDPEGTRSREVERQIMAAEGGEKRLILILNKIDLVPPTVLKGWIKYLRRFFPTLPLKASNGAPNAQSFDHKSLTTQGTSAALLKSLKSFAHSKQLKRAVTVGVIGFPNVGKSSVINALTGRLGGSQSACPTGAEAGITTSLREVKLDKKLKLLDSPGIVFPSGQDGSKGSKIDENARLVLLNVVPPKMMSDPIPAVKLLLSRLATSDVLLEKLLEVYGVPPLVNTGLDSLTRNFLIEVARKRGRLGKGGVPNLNSAAIAVIMDWRDGRIQGWVDPPINMGTETVAHGIKSDVATAEPDQKEIVSQWMGEFKIDDLLEGDTVAEVEMEG